MADSSRRKKKGPAKTRRQTRRKAERQATTSSAPNRPVPATRSDTSSASDNAVAESVFTLRWLLTPSPRLAALFFATLLAGIGVYLNSGPAGGALDLNAPPPDPWFAREINADMRLQRFSGIHDIAFYDDLNGVVVGANDLFATTSDGGLTWVTPSHDWTGLTAKIRAFSEPVKAPAASENPTPTIDRIEFSFEQVVLTGQQSGFVRAVYHLTTVVETAPGEIPTPPRPALGNLVLPIVDGELVEPPWLQEQLETNRNPFMTGDIASLVATGADSWKAWGRSGDWVIEWDGQEFRAADGTGSTTIMATTPVLPIAHGYVEVTTDELVIHTNIQVVGTAESRIPLPPEILKQGVDYVRVSAVPGAALVDGNGPEFDLLCIVDQQLVSAAAPAFGPRPPGRLSDPYDDLGELTNFQTRLFTSRDDGKSWVKLSAIGLDLENIGRVTGLHFFSDTTGCLTTAAGDLFRTVDGGLNWSQVDVAGTASFVRITARPIITRTSRLWAARYDGSIIQSDDQGVNWQHVALPVLPLSDVRFSPDGNTGIAAGRDGQLLVTQDQGITWQRRQLDVDHWAESVAFVDDRTAVVVGNGILQRTTDGGETWNNLLEESEFGPRQLAIDFASPSMGVSAGAGKVLTSSDSGATWQSRSASATPPSSQHCGVDWVGANVLVAVGGTYSGRATVDVSADQGLTWSSLPVGSGGSPRYLRDVKMLSAGRGWAVGERGWIISTNDNWKSFTEVKAPTTETLLRVEFRDAKNGLIVGLGGTVLQTIDGGVSWTSVNLEADGEPIDADLSAVYFVNKQRGYIAGGDETLLKTEDGGQTWSHARRYRAQIPPATSVLFGLAGLLVVVSLKLPGPSAEELNLKDTPLPEREELWNVGQCLSDGPIENAGDDHLNFEPVANGLARYITHEATEPPLTIAITGEWGSGKSSLMNLLADRIRQQRRPIVEFNAWHFQNEENLLAALLESIRRNGVPKLFSLDGIGFRVRLIRERIRRRWGLVAFMFFMWTAFFVYLEMHVPDWRTEPSKSVSEMTTKLDRWWKHDDNSLYRTGLSGLVGLIGLGGGGGTILVAVRTLRAFGVSPGRLGQAANNGKEADRRVQFREEFQLEFQQVSRALHPNVMVLFIDDLDRCRPENVMTVLQAVNFLVSSGGCIIVFGMAIHRVREAVALARARELSDTAGADIASDTAQEFAEDYMEKLVQIEVPIPRATDIQTSTFISSLVDGRAAESDKSVHRTASQIRQAEQEREKRLRSSWARVSRYAMSSFAILVGLLVAPMVPSPDLLSVSEPLRIPGPGSAELQLSKDSKSLRLLLDDSPQTAAILKTFDVEVAQVTQEAEPAVGGAAPAPPPPEPKSTESPVENDTLPSATVNSIAPRLDNGQALSTPQLSLIALLTLTTVVLVYSRIRVLMPLPVEKDSDSFLRATKQWMSVLSLTERRPRYLKRFVNLVRLHVMLTRDDRDASDDEYIVGLNALYQCDSLLEVLDEDDDDFKSTLSASAGRVLTEAWKVVAEKDGLAEDINQAEPEPGTIAHGIKQRHSDIARFCSSISQDSVGAVKRLRESVKM